MKNWLIFSLSFWLVFGLTAWAYSSTTCTAYVISPAADCRALLSGQGAQAYGLHSSLRTGPEWGKHLTPLAVTEEQYFLRPFEECGFSAIGYAYVMRYSTPHSSWHAVREKHDTWICQDSPWDIGDGLIVRRHFTLTADAVIWFNQNYPAGCVAAPPSCDPPTMADFDGDGIFDVCDTNPLDPSMGRFLYSLGFTVKDGATVGGYLTTDYVGAYTDFDNTNFFVYGNTNIYETTLHTHKVSMNHNFEYIFPPPRGQMLNPVWDDVNCRWVGALTGDPEYYCEIQWLDQNQEPAPPPPYATDPLSTTPTDPAAPPRPPPPDRPALPQLLSNPLAPSDSGSTDATGVFDQNIAVALRNIETLAKSDLFAQLDQQASLDQIADRLATIIAGQAEQTAALDGTIDQAQLDAISDFSGSGLGLGLSDFDALIADFESSLFVPETPDILGFFDSMLANVPPSVQQLFDWNITLGHPSSMIVFPQIDGLTKEDWSYDLATFQHIWSAMGYIMVFLCFIRSIMIVIARD